MLPIPDGPRPPLRFLPGRPATLAARHRSMGLVAAHEAARDPQGRDHRRQAPRRAVPGAAGGQGPVHHRLPPPLHRRRSARVPAHVRHRPRRGRPSRGAIRPRAQGIFPVRQGRARVGRALARLVLSPSRRDLGLSRTARFPEPDCHPALPDGSSPSARGGSRGTGDLPQREGGRPRARHGAARLLVRGGPASAGQDRGGVRPAGAASATTTASPTGRGSPDCSPRSNGSAASRRCRPRRTRNPTSG